MNWTTYKNYSDIDSLQVDFIGEQVTFSFYEESVKKAEIALDTEDVKALINQLKSYLP